MKVITKMMMRELMMVDDEDEEGDYEDDGDNERSVENAFKTVLLSKNK